jgi:transcription-repair coupling factor (superfamily II helicase)
VEKLEAGPKGMVLTFQARRFANPAGLIAWLGARRWQKEGLAQDIKLRPDHRLVVSVELRPEERVKAARRILGALARIAREAKAA